MGADDYILGPLARRPPSPVQAELSKSQREAFQTALEIFQSPKCRQVDNCYIVDYTDVFTHTPADSKRLPPHLNPSQKEHLAKGLNWLLASLRFVPWILAATNQGGDLSDMSISILRERYLHSAKEEMRRGGVGATFFQQIGFLENGLESGSLRRQADIELAIRGIILGYTVYLQKEMGLDLDWEVARKKIEDRQEEVTKPAEEIAKPSTALPSTVEVEARPKPERRPPSKKPEAKEEKPVEEPKPLPLSEKKLPEPPSEVKSGDGVLFKRKKLEELAKETGGEVQDILPSDDIGEAVKERLTIQGAKKPRHYQVMFLIDASGSMQDNVKELQVKIPEIIKHTRRQLIPGGEVSFGVGYYVDETRERPTPLDSYETLSLRANVKKEEKGDFLSHLWSRITPPTTSEEREAQRGLSQAIGHIREVGGGVEYHWEVAMEAMKKEPWAATSDVERVIFVLTDEDGDIGEKEYTKKDVEEEAKKRGIRFEVIRCLEEGGTEMSVEEAEKILSYPLGWKLRYNESKRQVAADVLGATRSPRFISHLAKALNPQVEQDVWVRRKAAWAMEEIGDPQAIPYLAKALNPQVEQHFWIRGGAARAMGEIGDPQAIPHLAKVLNPQVEQDVGVRRCAASAMGEIGDPQAIPYLAKALNPQVEQYVVVRSYAALAMGRIGDPQAIRYLEKAAKEDSDVAVRDSASTSIQIIQSKQKK